VSIEKRDLVGDKIYGTYDLIFVMDILEYVRGFERIEAVVSKLAAATRPGGLLVVSDCDLDEGRQHSWTARKLVMTRNQRLGFFHKHPQMRLIHEETYPESGCDIPGYLQHVISVFERR
jgi:2-polyprenyl-3-methyl-5-hydroxy-6-metoxy-1,4-benzoquinol methylase